MVRALAAVLVGACSSASAQQPVLRYTFDEPSGNALDSGATPLTDAALIGGATRSADTPSGTGMSLDLRSDNPHAHLLGSDASDLDGLTALTLTTWLKIETYDRAMTSPNKRLLAKQSMGATFSGFSFNMNPTPNDGDVGPDNFRLSLSIGSADTFDIAFSDADAGAVGWSFIAATYNSTTAEIAFYSGGPSTPVSQLGSTQFAALAPTPIEGDARFGVGITDAAPTADTSVTGLQDDVRVYDTALSLPELEAIRLQGVVPEPTGIALLSFAWAGSILARRRLRIKSAVGAAFPVVSRFTIFPGVAP